MKICGKFAFVLGVSVALVLSACGNQNNTYSGKTGWTFNDAKQGYFHSGALKDNKCPAGMTYIPVATTVRGQNNEKISLPTNNTKKRVAVSAFYMDVFEVSNEDWREYVAWMSGVWRSDPNKVVRVLPDESVWRSELSYNEPYVRDYYSNMAFNRYPVVGVSWKQAVAYCEWRTDRINEKELIANGVIPYKSLERISDDIKSKGVDSIASCFFTTKNAVDYIYRINSAFENNLSPDGTEYTDGYKTFKPNKPQYDLNKDTKISVDEWKLALNGMIYDSECRLPTETEWEYAAYGLETYDGEYSETNIYPWSGDQLRSFDDKFVEGNFRANFLRGRGDPVGIQINGTLTVPVDFFYPNAFGLYNMAGNVNEWVSDVYRAYTDVIDEVNSYRGNKFENDSVYAENIISKYFAGIAQEDRDSMISVIISERGITKTGGDYRNFKDGDVQSSLNREVAIEGLDSVSEGGVVVKLSAIEKANMISNTARVFKGGGWNDRVIWLDPANRRYLEETQCRNDLGFRCVMSAVGGDEQPREYSNVK